MAKQGSVKSCVKLIENGTKYPQAPLSSVHIVERPKLGEKKIFFNPRSPESFDVEGMKRLRETIQVDGLQQPLLVRAISKEGGKNIEYLELIAGERRKRCLEWLIQYDAPCYDDDSEPPAEYNVNDWVVFHCQIAKVEKVGTDGSYTVLLNNASCPAEYGDLLPTVPASQLYTNVPCKVVYNCDDRRALRLSVTENGDHQPLTTSEEIDLVERLVVGGFKQEEICEIIDQNVTWVSQTSNFRLQLPPAAFEKLLAGKLARNVAVNILSFAPQDRQTLYDATVSSEEEERKQSVESLQQQQERHEDAQGIALGIKKKAEQIGDESTAAKAAKQAEAEAQKAKKAKAKIGDVEKDAGTLRQGHVQRGAAKVGIKPKKAKILPKADIEDLYVDQVKIWEKIGHIDPVTEHKIPGEYLALVRYTALAILEGERDPAAAVRTFMVKTGRWEIEGNAVDDSEDDINDFDEDSGYDDEEAVLKDEFEDAIEEEDDVI